MSEERFKEIEKTIKDLAGKVSHLDKSFVEINVSLKDYANWTKQLEKTIRNLDDTVREMNAQNQRVPYERIRDIQSHIDPIHDTLRKHEGDFLSKKDAQTLTAISIFFISSIVILVGAFSKYVLDDVSEDIIAVSKANKGLIEKNAESIKDHDAYRTEILRSIHNHAEVP